MTILRRRVPSKMCGLRCCYQYWINSRIAEDRRRDDPSTGTLMFGFALFVNVLVVTIMVCPTSAVSTKEIKIGALFLGNKTSLDSLDALEKPMELAFRDAVNRVNVIGSGHPKYHLTAMVDRIVPGDSFHAYKKVCNMIRSGVYAIFGPSLAPVASHIQSVTNSLGIPHIENRWDYNANRSPLSLNLHPHPTSLSRAFFDLIIKWKWKSFAIIYDSKQGPVRLQELFKQDYKPKVKILVRRLEDGNDPRTVLKEVKKNNETRIILDCHVDKLSDILLQAQQMGMITHYYSYVITSLDFHTVDLEAFQHTATNITGFRIVDPKEAQKVSYASASVSGRTQEPMKTNVALMYDAVVMFADTLSKVISRSNLIEVQSASCEKGTSSNWVFGNGIVQFMKNMKMYGLTGLIRFNNTDGFRKEFNLDIVTLRTDGLQKIGIWNLTHGINLTITAVDTVLNTKVYLSKFPLRVTTKESEPYVMLKKDEHLFSGYQKYEGFCVDLMEEIAKYKGFNFTIQFVTDDSYGVYDSEKGEWNGVMKELIDQEADIGIGDLTINYERESSVDFTLPFMNLGISILYKKPIKKDPNLFSFLSPFSVDVWMYMITAYLGVSILLFLLARVCSNEWMNPHPCDSDPSELRNKFYMANSMWFAIGSLMKQGCDFRPKISPMEWINPHPCDPDPEELENQWGLANCMWFAIGSLMQQGCDFLPKFNPFDWENPHPCDPDPDELENKFSLMNSMWFTIGSLMQQGSDLAPKAISTRLVAGIWWFFTLIMISSYTASLAAFLTSERMVSPINSVEDLASQTKIKYGCVSSGTTLAFFQKSSLAIYQNMWTVMIGTQPSVFTESNQKGVDRVLKGGYAYFIESTANDYFTERHCDLVKIGTLLDSKSYGIATPPGSPFRTMLSSAVLHLQHKGTLAMLKEKWWKKKNIGPKCVTEKAGTTTASELDFANVGGVFVVLLGGLGIACIIGIVEFVWKTRKVVQLERVSAVGVNGGRCDCISGGCAACGHVVPQQRLALQQRRTNSGRPVINRSNGVSGSIRVGATPFN